MNNTQNVTISHPVSFKFNEPQTPVSSKFKTAEEFAKKIEMIRQGIVDRKLINDKLEILPKKTGFFDRLKVVMLYVVTFITFGKYDQFAHVRIHKVMHAILVETYNYRRNRETWVEISKLIPILDSKFKTGKNKEAALSFKKNCSVVYHSCVNTLRLNQYLQDEKKLEQEKKQQEEQLKQQQNEPQKKSFWQRITGR